MSTASAMLTTIDTAIASIVAKEAASIQIDGETYTALDLDKLRLLRKSYEAIVGRETAAAAATHTDVNPINWADAGAFFLEGYEYAKNETVARLQDPNTVYINMLRGTIATLSEDQINRLLQVQAEIETP